MASKNNPANPIVKAIKRLTTKVGVVKDLHGNVFDPFQQKLPRTAQKRWYYVNVPTTRKLNLHEIYDAIVDIPSVESLSIDDAGVSDLSSISLSRDAKEIVMLATGLSVKQASAVSLSIEAKNTDISVYLNTTKLRDGYEYVSLPNIHLQTGIPATLHIVLWRRSQQYTLTGSVDLDTGSSIIITPPVPDAASWNDDAAIMYGSVDSDLSRQGVILQWAKSPFVGGWYIERSSYTTMGPITGVVASGTTGFDFVVSGAASPILNAPMLVEDEYVGVPTEYSTLPGNQTTINVSSPLVSSGAWLNKKLYGFKELATIAEIDKITDIQDSTTMVFFDIDVVEGMPYSYRLYPWSAIDKSLVGLDSEYMHILAFDDTPPGPIVLWPNAVDAVSVDGDLIIVEHIYPVDADLAGYRIYSNSGAALVADLRRGNEYMLLDGATPSSGVAPARFGIFKFHVPELEGFDVENVITGYLATTYDFAGNELPLISGTYIPFTLLVELPENFTSFDNVVSPTKEQRCPSTIPEQLWRTAVDVLEANMSKAGYK